MGVISKAKKLSSFMELETLAKEVAAFYRVDREMLFAKFRKNNEPRQMLLFLSKKYCRGRYPLVDLANALGLTVNSFSSNTYKFQKSINNDTDLRKRVENLKKIFFLSFIILNLAPFRTDSRVLFFLTTRARSSRRIIY
jgi:chromosomal replication initiation ATPase DnaA